MRNKKSKSASTRIRVAEYILGGEDSSQMNHLVDSNILRGEQNFWDIGDQRYQPMKKVTISGSFQTQLIPLDDQVGFKY